MTGSEKTVAEAGAASRTKGSAARIAAVVGEHLLLLVALALLVPTVPSEKGQQYGFGRTAVFVGAAVAGSRVAAWVAGRESWVGVVVKTGMLVAAAYGVHLRVFGV